MTISTSRTTSIDSGQQKPIDNTAEDLLRQRRQSILRFAEQNRQLPIATQATCPQCSQQVPAEFDWADQDREQVLLRFDCPQCGRLEEAHDDMIWRQPPQSDRTGSAQKTYSGQLIKPNSRKLPRTVQTLCPECCALIVGRYFVEDGAVMIEKPVRNTAISATISIGTSGCFTRRPIGASKSSRVF